MEKNETKAMTAAEQAEATLTELASEVHHYEPYSEDTEQCLRSAVKFEENGKWGLKSVSGEIILEPKFEQIEFCADYIYARYNNRYRKQFYLGGSEEGRIDEDDYQFYENGKIGLKRADGSIFLPAIYDEIIDWGKRCDVVYARQGNEYHYYNHQHKEILTDAEDIAEDAYPNCPYNLGEDQHRRVLLCVEPIEKATSNHDCFAYNQWVRLSRIRYADVRKLFAKCKVVPMAKEAIEHFYGWGTYIYSARMATAKGDYPLTQCIEKLKSLGCYGSSWQYLVKISINKRTTINPQDFYNVVKHFEDTDGCYSYDIAIEQDDSMTDGEVNFFQIHYFSDEGPGFLYDDFKQEILPKGTLEDVKNALEKLSRKRRFEELDNAFWWIDECSKNRDWRETRKILEFLKSEGCQKVSSLLTRHVAWNYFWVQKMTRLDWQFKKRIISWAVANGGQLNRVRHGKTLYDEVINNFDEANEWNDQKDTARFTQNIERAKEFAEWLRGIGALTAAEQREKIEPKLEGLTPKEVLDLVART